MTDLDLDAIRQRLAAWDTNQDLDTLGIDWWTTIADVRALLAAVERLTAERDEWRRAAEAEASRRSPDVADALAAQARQAEAERDRALCEVDGVRAELARTVAELDDVRSDRMRLGLTIAAYLEHDQDRTMMAANLALSATQTPGVDSGTSEPDSAAHGDAYTDRGETRDR